MPIALRSDYDAGKLRAAARRSLDAGQTHRLLALAAVYDGATRSEAAAIGGVTLQIVRDWVLKLNDRGPDGLVDGKAPGPPSLLSDQHRAALARAIGGRADPGGTWGGPLADHRFVSVAAGRVRGHRIQADAWPRVASIGISKAVGPAAAPCASSGCYRGFKKSSRRSSTRSGARKVLSAAA